MQWIGWNSVSMVIVMNMLSYPIVNLGTFFLRRLQLRPPAACKLLWSLLDIVGYIG